MAAIKTIAREQPYTKLACKGYHVKAILRCVEELTPVETEPVVLFKLDDVDNWIVANAKNPTQPTRK